MVYFLFLFSPKQSLLQARECIQLEIDALLLLHEEGRRRHNQFLANLHHDALSLMEHLQEMPPNGLGVTDSVCFDSALPVSKYQYMYDDSGDGLQAQMTHYYFSAANTVKCLFS